MSIAQDVDPAAATLDIFGENGRTTLDFRLSRSSMKIREQVKATKAMAPITIPAMEPELKVELEEIKPTGDGSEELGVDVLAPTATPVAKVARRD